MKKLIILLFLILTPIVGFTIGTQLSKHSQTDVKTAVTGPAAIPTTVQEQENTSAPVTLRIPKLQVETAVESVGMDANGNMDVPKRVQNVAWYSPGFRPGQKGNAVIAGHYDTVTGAPAVFYNVASLEPGDEIYVDEANGKTYTFVVSGKQNYPYDSFPLQEVFGEYRVPRLNLITCEGTWDAQKKMYSHRTVVYSTLKD